jgi:F-type H+-transporting ATPase subunit b
MADNAVEATDAVQAPHGEAYDPHAVEAHDAATAHGTTEAGHGSSSDGLISPDPVLMGLTWLTFALMAVILYKVAWKPILNALDQREKDIQKAIEEAARTREELAKIDETRKGVLAEADAKAKEIVDAARRAAADASQAIEAKAREEAQILIQNAQREITTAQERAIAALRKESADMAVGLARKIIGSSLDEARARTVTDNFIREL